MKKVKASMDMPSTRYKMQLAQIMNALVDIAPHVKPPKQETMSAKAALKKCLQLSKSSYAHEAEPLRTIHHLSCVGGTLISKCVASMSNVLLLNELDFYSDLTAIGAGTPAFSPTDMVSLLRQGDRKISRDLIAKLLVADLKLIKEAQWRIGRSVVVRDHSHGAFLVGDSVSNKPNLHELFTGDVPLKSIVTVRDPADSFSSMTKEGWHKHFQPSTFDEYANRYHNFLDTYEFAAIIKYEDFANKPKQTMRQICKLLDLRYFAKFEQTFGSFQLSGDSGRGGSEITALPSREESFQYRELTSYRDLAGRLGYAAYG